MRATRQQIRDRKIPKLDYISSITDDVAMYILSFINPINVGRMSCVSKKYNEIINSNIGIISSQLNLDSTNIRDIYYEYMIRENVVNFKLFKEICLSDNLKLFNKARTYFNKTNSQKGIIELVDKGLSPLQAYNNFYDNYNTDVPELVPYSYLYDNYRLSDMGCIGIVGPTGITSIESDNQYAHFVQNHIYQKHKPCYKNNTKRPIKNCYNRQI